MKVFQDIRTAINEWEASREAILKIADKLQCSESEIMDKIGQLQEARPASDLNAINERLEKLMEGLDSAMQSAESVESQVSDAVNELEYVDASDAGSAIDDVSSDFDDFRKSIRNELEGIKE